MKETDLAKPVADWLRKQGYTVYSEVPFWNSCIDMVGFIKPDKLCIVELKLRFCAKGVRQAYNGQIATNKTYLAISKNPTQKSIDKCKQYGVGLLVVENNHINLICNSDCEKENWDITKKHLIDNLGEPSDIAGLPQMSGCGPAKMVGVFVENYVKYHPKAGWKEIYQNIPNHYSNHKSLSCAMSGYLHKSLKGIRRSLNLV